MEKSWNFLSQFLCEPCSTLMNLGTLFIISYPSQDYTHPDDHNLPNYDMTPGFKPFTVGDIKVGSSL